MMKTPTFLPRRVISMMDQQFITDAILGRGEQTVTGFVVFNESTPLFAEDDPQIMDEFGEIPVTNGLVGAPKVVRAVRRAAGSADLQADA
jgi:hypothetical protein